MIKFFSSSSTTVPINLLNKFKGTLLGLSVADCCGSPYENEILTKGDKGALHRCLVQLEGPMFKAPKKPFTDVTAMTLSTAKCLIENKSLTPNEIAICMLQTYFDNPKRNYSDNTKMIFHKLRQNKILDLSVAGQTYGGRGSFGNGAATRISPVALYYYNKSPDFVSEMIKTAAEITHTHPIGINGAILMGLTIQFCINRQSIDFNIDELLTYLKTQFEIIENEDYLKLNKIGKEYQKQIDEIQKLLNQPYPPSDEMILDKLGHTNTAQYSVPTAIFCFLKVQSSKDLNKDTVFRDSIEYAISLGGSTNTIASMTGSLVGCLYGSDIIPKNLIKHCEYSEEIVEIANQLYSIT